MDDKTKQFIFWICDPHCPFCQCFNGIDKTRDRICFEKSGKHYTIDQVYDFWEKNIFGKS